MGTLLYLLQAFGIVALVAAIALVTTLVVAEVKRSTTQIAVMKTGGATSGRRHARISCPRSPGSQGSGWPSASWAASSARGPSASLAFTLLNLDTDSYLADWWVFPVQAVIALAVPAGCCGHSGAAAEPRPGARGDGLRCNCSWRAGRSAPSLSHAGGREIFDGAAQRRAPTRQAGPHGRRPSRSARPP